jgi:2-desacetyl-2-hydroxyethyl bacteriochlorophyllide A dehydrogenase
MKKMDTAKMNVLVYEGPRMMNMARVPIPKPEEGEVLIRVERVGICGSELSGYLGQNSLRVPPLIMGHEFSGTVAALGAGVVGMRIGNRVTVNPLLVCGHCRSCREGRPQLCDGRKIIGAHRAGAFAEYVAVPVKNVLDLPDEVTFDQGAMTEPLACAVHIARLAQLDPADRLLIYGSGPIGLFVLQTAIHFGLSGVVMMELDQSRLQIAESLGASAAGSREALEGLMPEGGFDVVVDAVGVDATREESVLRVRPGGRIVFSGLHEASSPIPVNTAIRNEIVIKGSFCYDSRDFVTALDWLRAGKVNIAPWTQHSPLEYGQACFEQLLSNPGPVAKIILTL